ncbi:DNA repair protein RadC [archaeon]|nr:DNA repair protein RadC [archaeon]MBT5287456.1 DNA repair protein RadC [archaeon]MBT5423872.1 DNA repair protein RadC [archaeon]MBT7440153.1 DNA repair protein RadC [archaeon]
MLMRIKDISKENRPRERFLKNGVGVLSNAELLAIILKVGSKKENVIDMSNRLLTKYKIDKLSSLSLNELQEIDGIGPAKAMQIKALFEFNNRYNHVIKTKKIITIKKSEDVYNCFVDKLKDKKKEHFYVLFLDSKNKLISEDLISVGTLNSSIVHPREVFNNAIRENANSIILVHNHPSGNPQPSEEDKEITELLVKAGELLSIKVLDHVIIGREKWYSFDLQ